MSYRTWVITNMTEHISILNCTKAWVRAATHTPVPHTTTRDAKEHACQPLYCLSHVLFWCSRHMYEDHKTRSAIYEGRRRAQSAASLISKCSHGASALQPCGPALLFNLHLCLCTAFFFPRSFRSNKICSHPVSLQTASEIFRQHQRYHKQKHLGADRGRRDKNENTLITSNEPLSFTRCTSQTWCKVVLFVECNMRIKCGFVPM